MLKQLIKMYGAPALNSLTKYPSIPTLHALGEKGRLTETLNIHFSGDDVIATEKIDGTNVRIIFFGSEYIIGSRENLLTHSDDLLFDPAQGIVDGVRKLRLIRDDYHPRLTVVYGEFYGGNVTAASKQYGSEDVDFRIFDMAVFSGQNTLHQLLALPLEEISRWRESFRDGEFHYGQPFVDRDTIREWNCVRGPLVPEVPFTPTGYSREEIFDHLKFVLPQTRVALTPSAGMKPEGLVIRNHNRTKIAKIRYEDYERTFR